MSADDDFDKAVAQPAEKEAEAKDKDEEKKAKAIEEYIKLDQDFIRNCLNSTL